MANKTTNEKNKPSRKKLRPNEFYNPKTKRYEYHYVDNLGKQRVISSYRLEATDQTPKGKNSQKSLREREEEVRQILADDLDVEGSKLTLLEVADRYLKYLYNQKNLAPKTKNGHAYVINSLMQHSIGHMEVSKIKREHCEKWLDDKKKKLRGSSIRKEISLIRRVFEYAVDHDYIAKNPFRKITTEKKDSKEIRALTLAEMNAFLNFCKNDSYASKYYDLFYILFWTGLRGSELCGLTLDDIDMENKVIHVRKQLQVLDHVRTVAKLKTPSATRNIPMTENVYQCFEHVLANRHPKNGIEPSYYDEKGNVHKGFVFLTGRINESAVVHNIQSYLTWCIKKYNIANPDNTICNFRPHVCRHTFATNMQGLPPKTLQSILGHSDITTTMNRYVDPRPIEDQRMEINSIADQLGG